MYMSITVSNRMLDYYNHRGGKRMPLVKRVCSRVIYMVVEGELGLNMGNSWTPCHIVYLRSYFLVLEEI